MKLSMLRDALQVAVELGKFGFRFAMQPPAEIAAIVFGQHCNIHRFLLADGRAKLQFSLGMLRDGLVKIHCGLLVYG
jgi:hypothetical protein